MTAKELAEKDLKKARLNLARAMVRPNVSEVEIANLERQCALREEILNLLEKNNGTKENRPN